MTLNDVPFALAFFLLLSVVAGLVRVFRGPTPADRMLAVQLSGTGSAAILVALSSAGGMSGLLDVALVVALLAAATQIAFVILCGSMEARAGERSHHDS